MRYYDQVLDLKCMIKVNFLSYGRSAALFIVAGVYMLAGCATTPFTATPIEPCPHMPRNPRLLKNRTPAAQSSRVGSHNNAPTIASDPRGSRIVILRM